MKEFAKKFYSSRRWKETREAYLRSVGGLCELCYRAGKTSPAVIIHHKIPVTPETINDPTVTLSWSNFLAVCRNCHEKLHQGEIEAPLEPGEIRLKPLPLTQRTRYTVDDITGEVKIIGD